MPYLNVEISTGSKTAREYLSHLLLIISFENEVITEEQPKAV